MRDSQRQRFYDWEFDVIRKMIPDYDNKLIFQDCVELIGRVCRRHNIKIPTVKIARNNCVRSYYYPLTKSIHLSHAGHRYGVVLHEVAHYIADQTCPKDGGHGKYFTKVYCELMSKMFEIPLSKLIESAKISRLKVMD